mmetsp:Transcript_40586/g.107365  ORF Transcript_40586/g.107365 Transcript_40586/m.107365 type:complete len:100 (-) Transcript_40586:114-413(-)
MTAALLLLVQFVLLTAEDARVRRGLEVSEYALELGRAYAISLCQSLFVQESLKVLLITLVSPQMLPSLHIVRRTRWRELLRIALRTFIGSVYGVLILLA